MEISQFNPAQIDEVARMQEVDEDGLQAIAFAWMPGDSNDADVWVRNQFATLSADERNTVLTNESYLKRIDAEILTKMVPNSAKHRVNSYLLV